MRSSVSLRWSRWAFARSIDIFTTGALVFDAEPSAAPSSATKGPTTMRAITSWSYSSRPAIHARGGTDPHVQARGPLEGCRNLAEGVRRKQLFQVRNLEIGTHQTRFALG